MLKPLVLIESPYKGNLNLNKAYLELCLRDSIERGECPVATHKLYTVALDDTIESERKLGMEMLSTLMEYTSLHTIYYDLGVSSGMVWGVRRALALEKKLEPRSLFGHPIPREYLDLVNPQFGAKL